MAADSNHALASGPERLPATLPSGEATRVDLAFAGELTYGRQIHSVVLPAGVTSLMLAGQTRQQGLLYVQLQDSHGQLRAALVLQKGHKQVSLSAAPSCDAGASSVVPSDIVPAGTWQLAVCHLEGERRSPHPQAYTLTLHGWSSPRAVMPVVTETEMPVVTAIAAPAGRGPAWYCGDLHAHTRFSDGHNTLEQAMAIAADQQLDFLFLTEHNLCHPHLPVSDRTLILPGIEITTSLGHFNVHGPVRPLQLIDRDLSSAALIVQGLDEVAGANSHITINHPMMKPWHWHYDALDMRRVHALEVCCDPTWATSPAATEAALAVLNQAWQLGLRLTAVGGSDCHLTPDERNPQASAPSLYGDPATWVFAQDLTQSAILAGLRAGHVYLARHSALIFDLQPVSFPLAMAILPGMDVGAQRVALTIHTAAPVHDWQLQLIADGDCIATLPLGAQPQTLMLDLTRYSWLRCDIRDSEGAFAGLINPLYNGAHPRFRQPAPALSWEELRSASRMTSAVAAYDKSYDV